MRVIIIDDDVEMTKQIASYLHQFQLENHREIEYKIYHNPLEFLKEYQNDCDIIFFDVEMPEMNGIDAAKEIRKIDSKVQIMFITNMAQYAIHGYEVEAIDYVMKPISYYDFNLKMRKALRYLYRDADQQLILQTADGKIPMKLSDIYYIEVIRHYLTYHTAKGEYQVRGVMKDEEEKLAKSHFARCSQSYLVNLAHVHGINGNYVIVNEDEIPLSRNKKVEFLNTYARYVGGI